MSKSAKVVRLTADGQVNSGTILLAGIQLIGGTAVTNIYNGTAVVAANKVAAVTAPAYQEFDPPIYCPYGCYLDLGTGVTEALVHIV